MFPSELIPIKTYGSEGQASEDQARLNAARIPNYLGWKQYPSREIPPKIRYELKVPAEEVQSALRALGIEGQTSPTLPEVDEDAIRCPQCRSLQVAPLPPYPLIAILAVLPVIVFATIQGGRDYGFPTLVAGSLFVGWLGSRVDRWRCTDCGNRWRDASERPKGKGPLGRSLR